MRRNLLILIVTLVVAIFLYSRRPPPIPSGSHAVSKQSEVIRTTLVDSEADEEEATAAQEESPAQEAEEPQSDRLVLRYKIQNGLMVVLGDVVAGAPKDGVSPDGLVEMPKLKLWRGGEIPFHIQGDLPAPERVSQAIAMFEGTSVRFTPQNGERDVLVFEPGEKECLSYVGRQGGNQPIWLSDQCAPEDIAHEIMHALGFVHEQNRADRDDYITVLPNNIEEDEIHNFEKLPVEFMKVSGLAAFDFHSLMIYPVWMFAKNGQSTMESLNKDNLIQPGRQLSAGDKERIRRAYGVR